MYSDNGTNSTSANNELQEIVPSLQTPEQAEKIMTLLTNQGIAWQFTHPLSPHFGGIWEGAVKSFKHHLVLNSRPLIPISADPQDIQALTPGHFLIGTTLTAPPEKGLSDERPSLLLTWKLIQKMKQHFWSRWHEEYLDELDIRKKWTTVTHDIQIESIILLKEENIPPMQ